MHTALAEQYRRHLTKEAGTASQPFPVGPIDICTPIRQAPHIPGHQCSYFLVTRIAWINFIKWVGTSHSSSLCAPVVTKFLNVQCLGSISSVHTIPRFVASFGMAAEWSWKVWKRTLGIYLASCTEELYDYNCTVRHNWLLCQSEDRVIPCTFSVMHSYKHVYHMHLDTSPHQVYQWLQVCASPSTYFHVLFPQLQCLLQP